MKLRPGLCEATFVVRLNRFAAVMKMDGQEVMVHVANSGRMRELLTPENTMLIAPARSGTLRRTAFDLALVQVDGVLVSADARLPNALVVEALRNRRLPQFSDFDTITPEVVMGESRIDLLLRGESGHCYVETKSVTLVENGIGLFPDAPTERGRKHVVSLAQALEQGHRAAVVFVVQRPDAQAFAPHRKADPHFTRALEDAVTLGLEVYAYRCQVTRTWMELQDEVPVLI